MKTQNLGALAMLVRQLQYREMMELCGQAEADADAFIAWAEKYLAPEIAPGVDHV